MTDINMKERLCLSKEDDIYVDHDNLKQHQIDGLRTLYSTFKKKMAGVILNDPSGYGKTVTVVVFLKAMRKMLKSPALVLCRPAELQHWRHHFHTWDSTEDVIFESSNPYIKKSVFVSTRQHLPALCRRTWSVLVIDEFTKSSPVDLPLALQADYKILLASEDMKEKLDTFHSIYQWFYPNGPEFSVPAKISPLNKAYLIDFVFQDVVIRSNNFTPFKKPETQPPPTPPTIATEPPRISRKNKDATGTKIKRSKARIEAENQAPKVPRTEPQERNSTITSKDYYKDKDDVESFIKNEKPLTGEGVEEFLDFQAMIRSDAKELDKIRNENGEVTVNNENDTVCTADYQNAINDIVNNENDAIDDGHTDRVASDLDTGKVNSNESVNVSTENVADVISVSSNVEPKLDESKDETIQGVVNNGSKKDLDAKLMELEEKTLNKFKGSLLDSIF